MKLDYIREKEFSKEIEEQFNSRVLPGELQKIIDKLTKARKIPSIKEFDQTVKEFQVQKIITDGVLRPSFIIRDNTFDPSTSDYWEITLSEYSSILSRKLPSIGRINLLNHTHLGYAGTGFLIDENIVMTNRHVAEHFVDFKNGQYNWKVNSNGPIKAGIDYNEEAGGPSDVWIELTKTLYIEPSPGPDIAFFKVNMDNAIEPMELSTDITIDDAVVTIGYPTKKEYQPDFIERLIKLVYGGKFEIKRLSPGYIKKMSSNILEHDCSTLWGNSGSPILEIETGKVIGMHQGSEGLLNTALTAKVIQNYLLKIK